MGEEHGLESVLVLGKEKRLDRSGGEFRECRVIWSENGEWTLALQCLDEVGGAEGGGECLKSTRRGRDFDDVSLFGHHDGVNDVDHTVGGFDVGGDDRGSANGGLAALHRDLRSLAVDGAEALLLQDV